MSFFSSVSFCAICPCCGPSCVSVGAGAGGWTGGDACGETCVCGLDEMKRTNQEPDLIT